MRKKHLLNGWWDFMPVEHTSLDTPLHPGAVPEDGWASKAYLVPGFFTDHAYPPDWRRSRSGWAKTNLFLDAAPSASRQHAFLMLEAAIPMAHIFINGVHVYTQDDMFIGDEVDITTHLRSGSNELAVFMTEFKTFPHPSSGSLSLVDVPWGCCIADNQAGIWQDVWLEVRDEVFIDTVTVSTSVREGTIELTARVVNGSSNRFDGTISGRVVHSKADEPVGAVVEALLALPTVRLSIAPGESAYVSTQSSWSTYEPWTCENPILYYLDTALVPHGCSDKFRISDAVRTRFGFREVWIEDHRVMLNGVPQRWYGEWCHKSHSHWLRPEYVRQWYQQLKDLNCNYVRMHTFPHPGYFLDIADEMGILVCQETALHGSGQSGWETPQLWERFEAHIKRMIRRDGNHPSLVIWSVENEMRWSLNIVPGAKDRLPAYRKLINELDPSRLAYHEGDSSLWDESAQDIISRHYGPACHGLGWWDKSRPLHSGEMGRWHYASPYVALQWAGDEVFADYRELSQSIAKDFCRIAELGRANDVTSLFFWNTSGLDNFRPSQAKTFEWPDAATNYLKPLAHKPYESEYAWWEAGSGYRPGWSFELIKHALRPLALVLKQERTQFYEGSLIPHTVSVVNDLAREVTGDIAVALVLNNGEVWREKRWVTIGPGRTETIDFAVRTDNTDISTGTDMRGQLHVEAQLVTSFISDGADTPDDENMRHLRIFKRDRLNRAIASERIALIGSSKLEDWLRRHSVEFVSIDGDGDESESVFDFELDIHRTPVVIISEWTVKPGSRLAGKIKRFAYKGGRVLILEQGMSIFEGLPLARMPIEMAFIRDPGHKVVLGIGNELLRFFADHPFGLPSSDSWVTTMPYTKPTDGTPVRPIIDSSGGDFGTGGLQWAPVVEVSIGSGTVIGCQLRLADRWEDVPVADILLCNCLEYLSGYSPSPNDVVKPIQSMKEISDFELADGCTLVDGSSTLEISALEMAERVRAGLSVIVWKLSPQSCPYWSEVIGCDIDLWQPEHEVYQLVRADMADSPLTRGLSNEDTCWLDNWTYRGEARKDVICQHLVDIDGPRVRTHLTNCVKSALDWLYGDDNATEWKRTALLSQYFDSAQPRQGGGVVEVLLGDGRVIFVQMNWRPDLWQFRRFFSMLMMNTGVNIDSSGILGELVPSSSKASDGFPTSLRLARGLDETDISEVIAFSVVHVESYSQNQLFSTYPQWEVHSCSDGKIRLSSDDKADEASPILIGLEVTCPSPRKFIWTVGGLPNPDLQTFLRLTGEGSIRAYINGRDWGSIVLTRGVDGYIADIDFEAGINYVVLIWEPVDDDELAILFENKDRRPETTFLFG